MIRLDPYLNFNGNCEEAFNHYQNIFGGEFETLQRFSNVPAESNPGFKESEGNKIMHVAMKVGNVTLMGSDSMESFGGVTSGTNTHVSVNVDSEEDANRIFKELADGGKILMPLEKTFWNALFGMCTDRFGINWMVNYSYS